MWFMGGAQGSGVTMRAHSTGTSLYRPEKEVEPRPLPHVEGPGYLSVLVVDLHCAIVPRPALVVGDEV